MSISSRASKEDGSTTISKESTSQVGWKHGASQVDDDIVWSLGKPKAAKLYKITNNVNDKVYIGYTTHKLNVRFNQHVWASKNGSKSYFHNALNKYGKDAFIIELISDHVSVEEAKKAEIIAIANLKQPHYNLLAGGNGGLYVEDKEAWKEKLRKARAGRTPFKGHKHTETTKQLCGEASKRRWAMRDKSNELV